MDPYCFYLHQLSNPSSPSAQPAPQSAYHPHPAVNPCTFPNYGGYSTNRGPEREHAVLHLANPMMGGEPSTHGVAAACQCWWLTGGIPCKQGFAKFDDLIVHLRSHDVQGSAARKLDCQWLTDRGCCDKKYRRDGFKRHIGTHLRRSVPCTQCDKSFSRGDSMHAHRKKQHEKK